MATAEGAAALDGALAALAGTPYEAAFARDALHGPFIAYHAPGAPKTASSDPGDGRASGTSADSGKKLTVKLWTRGEFLSLAWSCAGVIRSHGVGTGDAHAHWFTGNAVEDLACRLAAVMLRSVPVTVNWQADTHDRIAYKATITKSKVLIVDSGVPPAALASVRALLSSDVAVVHASELPARTSASGGPGERPVGSDEAVPLPPPPPTDADTRIIIFTSGTTGLPKGVKLSYGAYACNRATFESFLLSPQTLRRGEDWARGLGVHGGDGSGQEAKTEACAGAGAGAETEGPVELVVLLCNPLHHTNSTAISDWALRRPGARIHLLRAYTTGFWRLLVDTAAGFPYDRTPGAEPGEAGAVAAEGAAVAANPPPSPALAEAIAAYGARARLVVPLVSRHFDFLDDLSASGRLPVSATALAAAASAPHVTLLLGSAPVGPTTVERLQRLARTLPTVRFGSTETCLQVTGTPVGRSEAETLAAFQAGWAHTYADTKQTGYYIGRPHPPFTEVEVVRSTQRGHFGYLVPCEEGEPGLLVARGANLMSGYVGNDEATAAATDEGTGWYLNLGDVCFWLRASPPATAGTEACLDVGGHGTAAATSRVGHGAGDRDFYWLSRESTMLIRGGANYSYEQVGAELGAFVRGTCGLAAADVGLEVVGVRVVSEHEDECCVAVELRTDAARAQAEVVAGALAGPARRGSVSKGAKPDRIAVGAVCVPRNFKGAVLHKDLAQIWKDKIAARPAFGYEAEVDVNGNSG